MDEEIREPEQEIPMSHLTPEDVEGEFDDEEEEDELSDEEEDEEEEDDE
jgi:hypothetical protein